MRAADWLGIAWGVCGVAVGLWAANRIYADDPRGSVEDRAFTALCGFICCVAFLPLLLAVGAFTALAWCGGWLLPAVRRERRTKRLKTRRVAEEMARTQIDELHQRVGLPPVDWDWS